MEKLKSLVSRIDKLAEELDEEEEEEQGEVIEKPSNGFTSRNRAGLLKQGGEVHPKVKKNVSFAENGKVYRVLRKACEPILEDYCDESNDRDGSVDAEDEDFSREVEEIGVSSKDDDEEEEDGEEDEDEDQLENDGEKESRIYSTSGDDDFFGAQLWKLYPFLKAPAAKRNQGSGSAVHEDRQHQLARVSKTLRLDTIWMILRRSETSFSTDPKTCAAAAAAATPEQPNLAAETDTEAVSNETESRKGDRRTGEAEEGLGLLDGDLTERGRRWGWPPLD
ncbi:hypothetical protein MIMGU_mgv1a011546mg [Erythranthe guttata]|uniref:Uncharacterized protein n=1 Tax=Erythranthe guttata TaxID=4155 RepID=A0A022R325_ERYGU|nr:hypothetical protein MIMGU_mgv1a011546mg [Erythranthe guttata]